MLNANSGIGPIGSSGGPNSPASVGGGSAISRGDKSGAGATNALADNISNSLTGGGRAQFATPGAQQDFQKGMRAAVGDLVEGAKSGNTEQMTKGLTAMISLITNLAKAQKSDSAEKPESGASKGAGESQGASAPASGSADGDKKKKLLELIQMLMAMGVPPEMISQLLEAMGMPPAEAKQLMSQASQAAGQNASSDTGAPSASAIPKGAISA